MRLLLPSRGHKRASCAIDKVFSRRLSIVGVYPAGSRAGSTARKSDMLRNPKRPSRKAIARERKEIRLRSRESQARGRQEADRPVLLADAERLEDHDHAGRMRASLRLIPVNISGEISSSRRFWRSRPTTACRPLSITTVPAAGGSRSSRSGAILQYLGRKTGKFYPKDERSRVEVDQWLFWQMANLGPKAGEANHFRHYAPEKLPYHRALRQRDEPDLRRDESSARTGSSSPAGTRSPTSPASVGRAAPSATVMT